MDKRDIHLSKLITSTEIDSISGRKFGQDFAETEGVLKLLENGFIIKIIIDDTKVKAINDSFWKGFLSKVFERLKSKSEVNKLLEFDCNSSFKKQIDKNFEILDSIYNES